MARIAPLPALRALISADGRLAIRVTPRASADRVSIEDGKVRVHVTAPPRQGPRHCGRHRRHRRRARHAPIRHHPGTRRNQPRKAAPHRALGAVEEPLLLGQAGGRTGERAEDGEGFAGVALLPSP